jgi:hypothetical protein
LFRTHKQEEQEKISRRFATTFTSSSLFFFLLSRFVSCLGLFSALLASNLHFVATIFRYSLVMTQSVLGRVSDDAVETVDEVMQGQTVHRNDVFGTSK